MQNNIFESQIEDKMEPLRLKPSEAVWVKIEAKLRQKRRRRYFLFFSIISASLLIGTLWGNNYFNSPKMLSAANETNPLIVSAQSNKTPATTTLQTEPNQINIQHPTIEQHAKRIEKTTLSDLKNHRHTTPDKEKKLRFTNKPFRPIHKLIDNPINPTIATKPTSTPEQINNADRQIGLTKKGLPTDAEMPNHKALQTPISLPVKDKEELTTIPQKSETAQVPDTASQAKLDENPDNTALLVNNLQSPAELQSDAPSPIRIRRHKMRIGIELAAGTLQIKEEPFPSFTEPLKHFSLASADAASRNAFFPQRPIDKGFSVKFGLSIKKPLNKRLSLLSGIGFVSGKTTQKIGITKKDLSIVAESNSVIYLNQLDGVYLYAGSPQVKNYTNRYYSLQLPLSLLLKLNKAPGYAIELNAGIAAGYMFYTNALQYDTLAGGINYLDQKFINPIRWSGTLGLNFSKTHKNGFSWSIGPVIAFDVNKFSKNYFNNYQYPLFTGISTRFYFNR